MNNYSKKFSVKIFFLFLGILIGSIWYKYDLPPRPLIRNLLNSKADIKNYSTDNLQVKTWEDAQLTFSKYKYGVPLFLNTPYADTIGDDRLEELYIIKINRHENRNIKIKTNLPITIYRLVNESNFNLKHPYEETDIKVKVVGYSLTHTNVLKKKFPKGDIILSPGGPIASSPILFSHNKNFKNILLEKTNFIINFSE